MGKAENSAMAACEQVAAIYRTPCMRMQSRTFNVPTTGGRMRPLFVGEWTDAVGIKHRKGMADLLMMPRMRLWIAHLQPPAYAVAAVPLWVETKAQGGKLSTDQEEFREFVTKAGAYYIVCEQSADALLLWFDLNGVGKV